jgi:hypothetical protein
MSEEKLAKEKKLMDAFGEAYNAGQLAGIVLACDELMGAIKQFKEKMVITCGDGKPSGKLCKIISELIKGS